MDYRITNSANQVIARSSNLTECKIKSVANSGSALTMGCACSSTLDFSYRMDVVQAADITPTTGMKVKLQYKPDGSNVFLTFGTYWITDITVEGKNKKITAYDAISQLGIPYNSSLSSENQTLQAIYNDIEQKINALGIYLDGITTMPALSTTTFTYADMTLGQALAYLAGCIGCYAATGDNGKIYIDYYDQRQDPAGRVLRYDEILENGLTYLTDSAQTIKSIATGTKDHPITKGNGALGVQLNFENPWITDAMATAIYNRVVDKTFRPLEVCAGVSIRTAPYAGNAWRIGSVSGDIFYTTEMNITAHKNGWAVDMYCCGESKEKAEFDTNFTSMSDIAKKYNDYEQGLLDLTEKMTGPTGGYVKLYDSNSDGQPDKVIIMDQPTVADSTKRWEWSQNGLAFTNNGGQTYRTGITSDGLIVADNVVAGISVSSPTISGGSIYGSEIEVGGQNNEDGTITVYDAASRQKVKLSNQGIVATKGTIGGWTITTDNISAYDEDATGQISLDTNLADNGEINYTSDYNGTTHTSKIYPAVYPTTSADAGAVVITAECQDFAVDAVNACHITAGSHTEISSDVWIGTGGTTPTTYKLYLNGEQVTPGGGGGGAGLYFGTTAPADTSKIWIDTTVSTAYIMKVYNASQWHTVTGVFGT